MNYNNWFNPLRRFILVILVFAGLNPVNAAGEANDTLQLKDAVEKVLQQYPTISLAMEALNASDAKISLARSGYLPDIDATASYTRIGPVPTFDFPSFGHIQLYPEDNYAASLNFQQTIYDFGRTARKIAAEQDGKYLSEQNIEVVKQQLTKRVISLYYSILYLQEATKIKNQQIDNLRKHLARIVKKKETGSATEYEVLSTQVKLTASETQKTDLESLLNIQLALLNSLLGQHESTKLIVSAQNIAPIAQEAQDSTIVQALKNRSEIKMALAKEKLMQTRISLTKADNKPVLRAYASAGGKNGYVPDIGKFRGNYSAGIGLRIPLYDASRTRYNISLARTSLESSQYEKEITTREITNEVIEYYQKEIAAARKAEQSEAQVQQAMEAFNLASTSYGAGAITNLDLLDATISLSESRLMLVKARIDLLIDYYGLQLAEGHKLFPEQ
jgi:outer membrane protein